MNRYFRGIMEKKMKYQKEQISMSDSNFNVFHSWIPDGEVKACVVLSHGMTEHAFRYNELAEKFCSRGIAFFGEDHRGHGETAALAEKNGTGMFGFLSDRNGFWRVVQDIHEEVLLVRNPYPQKKVFLLGHSFGSFVTQCFIENFGNDVDGAIICGSAGPRPLTIAAARIVGNIIKFFTGKKSISRLMGKFAFGTYNAHIKKPCSEFAWLSRSESCIEKYEKDPWCGFDCTIGFYCDLFNGLRMIHRKKNMKRIPQNLPVYLIAGTADPVGSYSKTVSSLFKIYHKNGITDLSISLWEDCRHELYNEINGNEIMDDSVNWIDEHIA